MSELSTLSDNQSSYLLDSRYRDVHKGTVWYSLKGYKRSLELGQGKPEGRPPGAVLLSLASGKNRASPCNSGGGTGGSCRSTQIKVPLQIFSPFLELPPVSQSNCATGSYLNRKNRPNPAVRWSGEKMAGFRLLLSLRTVGQWLLLSVSKTVPDPSRPVLHWKS